MFVLLWQNEGSDVGLDENVRERVVNHSFTVDRTLRPKIPEAGAFHTLVCKRPPGAHNPAGADPLSQAPR